MTSSVPHAEKAIVSPSKKPLSQGRAALLTGLLLVAVGLLVNPWSLGRTLTSDGEVGSASALSIIVACQAAAVLLGVLVLWRRPLARAGWLHGLAGVPLVLLALFGAYGSVLATRPLPPELLRIQRIERAEVLYLDLSARFKVTLNKSAADLEVPEEHSRDFFADEVIVVDLAGAAGDHAIDLVPGYGLRDRHWDVGTERRTVARDDLVLWRPFLEEVDYFKHAKFYIIFGDFADEAETRYETDMAFAALARMKDGAWADVHGAMGVVFERVDDDWKIASFETRELGATIADELLFEEVLDVALPNADERARARRSIHEEYVVDWFLEEDFVPPHEHFSLQAFDRQPGLSVVDLDRDGFDELYVMARWGKNMLLSNHGDGTFHDVAGEVGLDLEDHTSCALFADLDNDGDSDAVLGRTLERSLVMENREGRFHDVSERVSEPLPYLAISLSAADYDLDGLLDVYFSTYAAEMFMHPRSAETAPKQFLAPEDLATFEEVQDESLWILARAGPPNVLLHNEGSGAFQVARGPDAAATQVWRNTFQGTWTDYDEDGDPDLYCANDFSINNMVRNDGEGRFVDVTEETGTADIGFGMGVSWGDFDNDGDADLYVTNMYSKAGRRITRMAGGSAEQFAPMARGNTLFANAPERFDRVSGLTDAELKVEAAGWSWGGQFVDVDNDAYLDVYALSGHYTAPDEVAIPVDT